MENGNRVFMTIQITNFKLGEIKIGTAHLVHHINGDQMSFTFQI